MLAAQCEELTEIRLSATEPHIQDLCNFLVRAGAAIEGIGSPTLKVRGGKLGSVRYEVIPDELEISAFACLAAATHSEVTIAPIRPEYLDAVLFQLEKMHVHFEQDAQSLRILPSAGPYVAARLQAGLYPKLVTDHLPPFVVLATQAEGNTLVHDWLFEARQSYIRELAKMGASTMIMDPHRALIIGPTPLFGKEVTSYDIRSGMAMVVAALVAKGKTTLLDAEYLDRGYEHLDARLRALGADIRREE
jgi:UDP-N-acetylglucosamine 1-carboxyvinyltransferase